jgi:hypothetical protein
MATPRSSLSTLVTHGFWQAVRQLLEERHRLPSAASRRAISTYKAVLAKTGVGDEIYHAPIAETATGIVNGGYVTSREIARSAQRGKRSQSMHHRKSGQ